MKETLKEQAYRRIKEKIINCEYRPGTFLNEDMLKDEMNASRTPIRDAVSRLEQENLVKIFPKKGILVSELSIREINAIYEARMLIEPYAVLHYGSRISEEQYREFLYVFSGTGPEDPENMEVYNADSRFHHAFVDASGNAYLTNMYNQISSQNRRLRILSGAESRDRLRETFQEHRYILEDCLRKDWDSALNRMKEHLANSRKASFDVVVKSSDINL